MSSVLVIECGCEGVCGLSYRVPLCVADELREDHRLIVDGCPNGAPTRGELVMQEDGYSIYRIAAIAASQTG